MLHTCTSFSREGSRACPSSLQKLLLVKREAALVLMACLVFSLKDASVFPLLGILPGHFFPSSWNPPGALFYSSWDPLGALLPPRMHLGSQQRAPVLIKETNMTDKQTASTLQ